MDGDARGGAALSAKHVTGKPILFAGMSEKIDGLEPFHPDRIAGRILGMGDVLTLIEKAKALEGDDDGALEKGKGIGDFSLADMLTQMRRIKQMGSFTDVLGMIPGANKLLPAGAQVDEREIGRVEAIISSMTERERRDPQAAQRQPPQAHRAGLRDHGAGRQPAHAQLRGDAHAHEAHGQAAAGARRAQPTQVLIGRPPQPPGPRARRLDRAPRVV